jgi:hypothetical protein
MPIISCEKWKEFVNNLVTPSHQNRKTPCAIVDAISCNLIIHKMDDGVIQEPKHDYRNITVRISLLIYFAVMEAFIKRLK